MNVRDDFTDAVGNTQGLEAAQQSRRISLAQFQASTAIALEVIDAADRLADARLELASSIVDYNLAQVRVPAATGAFQLELLCADP